MFNFFISQLHISSPEVTFPKSFDVAADISSVYKMYLFQVKHFSNKYYLNQRKSEVDASTSGGGQLF
jgi:hypothetical protein